MLKVQELSGCQVKIKYILDRIAALVLVVLLLPLLLLIYIAVKIDSKGHGIFIQERVGLGGKTFKIYKFRTMKVNAANMGSGIIIDGENDPRITRVGKILRRLSLDELPQLINIIKGEMSFIGPRPTLKYQVDKYSEHQMRRLSVKPGITGWAQVNGRNSIPWSKRIEYDIWYVNNYSLLLDLKILLKTLRVLFKDDNIYGQSDEISKMV